MINQFFKENEKVAYLLYVQISETNLFDLKSRVKDALSKRPE